MGCHAEKRTQGDHAGSADASDQDVIAACGVCGWGHWQGSDGVVQAVAGGSRRLARLSSRNSHETGAKAFDAGKILVTGRLIDLPFSSKERLQWLHRNAVGGDGAIAATLTHHFVDESPFIWVGKGASFTTAAFFCRAGLIVYQDASALNFPQLPLNMIEFITVANGDTRGPFGANPVFVWFIANHNDLGDALMMHLLANFPG